MPCPALPCGTRRAHAAAPLRALAAAVLAVAALARPASALDITRDMGGPVEPRIARIATLRASGEPVRILGTCVSACTLYLGLPGACVSPRARLGFHGPTSALPGIPLEPREFERISRRMAALYPEAIASWFMAEARLRTGSYHTLTGAQAIAMGARRCA